MNVDRFLLEYDTDRAGGFEPLRFVPTDKMVVLGLISSKEPELESVDALAPADRRGGAVRPAGEPGHRARSAASPRRMLGNLLTWDQKRRKLELVVETARAVWG